jgi:hypothetical protein
MKKAFKKTVPFLMAILFLGSLAYSQIREAGIIQGNVTDAEGNSLPGVTVTVESPGLIGGVHTRLTDAGGFYKFPFMTVGVYKVTAELAGFSKSLSEGIKVNAGKTLTVDFKLIQATLASEVTVKAAAPTIDVKSSQSGTITYSTELIQTLPGKPTFDGLFNMAPGTDYYTSYGSGYASPNAYQTDGVSVVDPMWGGISFSIDTNVIEEATFQGLGMPAEYGEASGAVLTAVTKSGSNTLSGSVDIRYNDDGWNSQNLGSFKESDFRYPGAKTTKYKIGNFKEISAQVGGKIIRDKLWFFLSGGYNYSDNKALGLSYITKTFTPTTFTKLTYQLNKSNKFNVSYKFANNRIDNYIFNDDIGVNSYAPGNYLAVSWTSIFSPTTYLDVKAGLNHQKTDEIPIKGLETPGRIDLLGGVYVDNVITYQKGTGRTFHLSAHLSHYIPHFITGSHDIRVGAEIQRDYTLTLSGYPGGEMYLDFGPVPFLKMTMAAPLNQNAYFGPIVGFFQDTWTLTKRLTLNIGFRYDNYYFNIPLLDPQSKVRPSTIYKNNALAPRLGITYDLLGDRKNIFKLYYGRLYEKINRNQFNATDTRSAGFAQYSWQNGAWVKILEWVPGEPPSPIAIDPKAKHPYINELSGAYERELFKDASLSVNVYYKTLGKALGQINTTAQWETITVINPGPDGIVGTSDDLGPLDVYQKTTPLADDQFLITNPVAGQSPSVLETPWKKMRGIEFIFSKKYSKGWQLLASYHYTKCTGNTDNVQVDLTDPNRYVNSRGEMVYYYGQPHQFKLQGSVLLPLNIMLGVTAQYISGHPVQGTFYSDVNPTITQINGFVWGDKKWGPLKDVSMKFEKRFLIKGVELTGYVDFYNVFNFHCTPYSWNRVASFGPEFGKISSVQAPRSFRVGARLYF